MVEYRRSLAASFLFKGLLFAAQQLEADAPSSFSPPFPDTYRSGEVGGLRRVVGGWVMGGWGGVGMVGEDRRSLFSSPRLSPTPTGRV